MEPLLELSLESLEIEGKGHIKALDPGNGVAARCLTRKTNAQFRRAWSESKLLEVLPVCLVDGYSYHCISGGNIDSLSYLKHIVRMQPLEYCLISTWCMAGEDVRQIEEWLQAGRIGRMDAYVGEIFPGSYGQQYRELVKVVSGAGGRVCVFRNHAKVFAGRGEKFCFAVESSANINTNPRTEQTAIHVGQDIFHFYKDFFDDIKSYTKDSQTWTPYV